MATPKKSPKNSKRAAAKGGNKSAKAGLIFPVGRTSSLLRKGRYAPRVGASAGVYLAGVLEYLTAELLELSAKANKDKKRITPRAITLAVRGDEDLGSLLKDVTLSRGGVVSSVNPTLAKKNKAARKSSSKKVVPTVKLTREQSDRADTLFRQGNLSHKWQYFDRTWQDYDRDATAEVERAYASWTVNPHIDVRSVSSGDWDYMVDFNLMQQTNIRHSSHTVRKIRRVALKK